MGIFDGMDMTVEINEYIQFGDFDSRDYKMYLINRSAPTPAKRPIKEPVAFMHGAHDFSRMLGEDIYDNRYITYRFHLHENRYENRKVLQTSLENRLMKHGITDIFDTYSRDYHYKGKVLSVDTEDDHRFNRLIVSIEFECYPFKISDEAEGNDIWDTFNFELDVTQTNKFVVDGTETIDIYNVGVPSVRPKITVTGNITLIKSNQRLELNNQTFESDIFRLTAGSNEITLEGNGTVEFEYYKELI